MNWGKCLYDLCLVGTFFLAYALFNRRVWIEKPAFVAYIAINAISILALHPLFRPNAQAAYAQMYWYWQIASIVSLGVAVGELFNLRRLGVVLGAMAGGAIGIMILWTAAAVKLGDIPAARHYSAMKIQIDCYAGITFALIAALAIRGISGIASGLAVSALFSSIAILTKGPLRYAATAAWIVALFLWLDWVRTYRESALKPPNHAHGKRYGRRVYGQIQRQALGFLNTSH